MRTVDPLGRHDECAAIAAALDRGQHVVVVGHAVLGADAVRRRTLGSHPAAPGAQPRILRHLAPASSITVVDAARGARAIAWLDAIDPHIRVRLPRTALDGVTVVRLARLDRRRLDRLVDDRLVHRGLDPSWLGHTDRTVLLATSAGYPALAAALVDERISAGRRRRAPTAANQVLTALDAADRSVAAMLASVPGIGRARIERHVDPEAIARLVGLGIVTTTIDGVRVGPAFQPRLTTASGRAPAILAALHEIVRGWRKATSTTPSELLLAAHALEDGAIAASRDAAAAITAVAAAATFASEPRVAAMRLAARVRALDPTLMPTLMQVLESGDGNPFDAFMRDATDRGHDVLLARLGDELLRASVLVPDGAPMHAAIAMLSPTSSLGTLARELRELDRARIALDEGRHADVLRACTTALETDDALVAIRAHGMFAVSAATLGHVDALLHSTTTLRRRLAAMTRWTATSIAVTTRTIAQVRAAISSVGLPAVTMLDESLDRLTLRATIAGDGTSVGYACLAELASRPDQSTSDRARRTIAQLPAVAIRHQAPAFVAVYEHAATAPVPAHMLRSFVWATSIAVTITTLEALETADPAELLDRIEQHLAAGVQQTCTLRVVAAHLRTRLGMPVVGLEDVQEDTLSPLLLALVLHARGVATGEGALVADAARLVVTARHRRLAEAMLLDASRLGVDPARVAELHTRLAASVAASAQHPRGNRRWIDRDAAGLAAAGLSDHQIAELVAVPLGTVRARARAVMADLGVAVRDGLRDPTSAADPAPPVSR